MTIEQEEGDICDQEKSVVTVLLFSLISLCSLIGVVTVTNMLIFYFLFKNEISFLFGWISHVLAGAQMLQQSASCRGLRLK